MKKGFLLILLSLIIFSTTDAQVVSGEEINYSIISKVQSYLERVEGWSLQDNGKWANDRNRIPHSNYKTNKNPTPREKLGIENFNVLELKKVLIEDKQYNVLLIKYQDGEYEFPLLQEGWNAFESLEFWVFDAKSLSKLLPNEVPYNQPYAVDMKVYCSGRVINYDPKLIDDYVVGKIQSILSQSEINSSNLVFAVEPLREDGKESVKFKMIRSFNKRTIVSYYLDPRNAGKLFDISYYEAKFHEFQKFIRDSEVFNIPTEGQPDDYESYYKWGILKYQAGNFDGAIDDFNTALNFNQDTTHSMIYSYRGMARAKMGNHNAAIEDFSKAIDIQPKDIMGYSNWVKNYYNRGVCRFYENDVEGACRDWNKAFDLGFGGALEYLEKFCK